MNVEVERLFQSIGNHVLDMVGDSSPKALAYAEVVDSAVSVSIFFLPEGGDIPYFKFGGKPLSDLFYSLWLEWGKENKQSPWLAAAYFIQDGKPKLELVYAESFDEKTTKNARRSAMVEKYFGSSKADYSKS